MSAERNSDQELEVDVDVTGDSLQIQRETVESVKIDRLFQPVRGGDCDARLILWSDSAGWNGFERRDGEFYRVNVLVDTVIEGKTVETESEYVADEHVDPEDVADALRTHIRDEKAGGAGRFAGVFAPMSSTATTFEPTNIAGKRLDFESLAGTDDTSWKRAVHYRRID